MGALGYIISIVLILFSILIIGVVLLQEGRQGGISAVTGSSDSFFDKGKARTLDAILGRWTKIIAIVFFVLVFAGMLITKFAVA